MINTKALVKELEKQNLTLSTFESATGGLIASEICAVPGVSKVFLSSIVTYQTKTKIKLLGLKKHRITKFGVISQEIAKDMVVNGCKKTKAKCGISITGNAGPNTLDGKPNGLFYIGFKVNNNIYIKEFQLHSAMDRNQKRKKITEIAINYLLNLLKKSKN